MILISREWAMPSVWTFRVPPIAKLIAKYVQDGIGWLDPFAGESSPAEITNDIEGRGAKYQMDALEFLRVRSDGSASGVLFDPPYQIPPTRAIGQPISTPWIPTVAGTSLHSQAFISEFELRIYGKIN